MERRIRRQKRQILVDDAAGDKEKLQRDQIKLQVMKQNYARFSKGVDLPMQHARMETTGFTYKEANAAKATYKKYEKSLENSGKSDIMGMYRSGENAGKFSVLPERMSKKHIREIAKEFDIDIKGISLTIDTNEELLGIPFTGRADSERIGGITFFPNAFTSRENLLRTLYHEKIHVRQFREYGTEYVQNNRAYFEQLAYDEENTFIAELKKKGVL